MATTQLSRAAYERLQAEFEDLTTRGRIEVAVQVVDRKQLDDNRAGRAGRGSNERGHDDTKRRRNENRGEPSHGRMVTLRCRWLRGGRTRTKPIVRCRVTAPR